MTRCLQMAEAAALAVDVPLNVELGLREIDHGAWDERGERQVEREEPQAYREYTLHPGSVAAPDGENGYDVAARALPVVRRISEAHRDGRVLVVSHKATVRILVCALLGMDVRLFRERIGQPVCALSRFEIKPGGTAMLTMLGDVSHLPADLRIAEGT